MAFPKMFRRSLGMAPKHPLLGGDAAPTDNTYKRNENNDKNPDGNVMSWRLANINGFPQQRVVVGYQGPVMAQDLNADAFLWDDTSGFWFKVNHAAVVLHPGEIAYFDFPSLLDVPTGGLIHQTGALEIAIVVAKNAMGDPDGDYTFVVGADVSNPA